MRCLFEFSKHSGAVEKYYVRKIKRVPKKFVLDSESVTKFRRRKYCVANFFTKDRFESAHCRLELCFVETVCGDEHVCRTGFVSHKRTGEDNGRESAGALQRVDDSFVAHRRDVPDETLE